MSTDADGSAADDNDDNDNNSSKQIVNMNVRSGNVTIPISLLIESLVKYLCTVHGNGDEHANDMYNFICNYLYQMELIDESYHMSEFEGIRSQYEKALYRLVMSARERNQELAVQPLWSNENFLSDWSRYCREFDELEYIAGGGFGQVFRVRHKLDGNEYAVKKIYIHSNSIKSVMKYLAEVKTSASLNHANIVQYKAAWLELGVPLSKQNRIETINTSFNTYEEYEEGEEDESDFTVQFKSKTKSNFNTNISNNVSSKLRSTVSEGDQTVCKLDVIEVNRQKWATLYIQMSLCQITLKEWLHERSRTEVQQQLNSGTVMNILKQLLSGLQYIHSRGIVHHDIKPSNIFIQMDAGELCVQLGDFGLACPLQKERHSLAFGTKLYAAPEQLAGECNAKSDLYSLGIVLLELVETFQTDMERSEHIVSLRKGRFHLLSRIPDEEPLFANIISQLVSRKLDRRPNATELLEDLNQYQNHIDNNEQIQVLKTQLAEKDDEIERLRNIIKSLNLNPDHN